MRGRRAFFGALFACVVATLLTGKSLFSSRPPERANQISASDDLGKRADPRALAVEARSVLEGYLGSSSQRLRTVAAVALSHSGDVQAEAELLRAAQVAEASLDSLEAAYALGCAGDASGFLILGEALRSSRRDVRLAAARDLARLSDNRGAKILESALHATTQRLGAADALASLGDEHAFSVLHEALADRHFETRLRAALALSRHGDASGAALLHDVVQGERMEVGAAVALARLGDASVVPVLMGALALSALRVDAALGLRSLRIAADATVLEAALWRGSDLSRISAAEAILSLAEPELR